MIVFFCLFFTSAFSTLSWPTCQTAQSYSMSNGNRLSGSKIGRKTEIDIASFEMSVLCTAPVKPGTTQRRSTFLRPTADQMHSRETRKQSHQFSRTLSLCSAAAAANTVAIGYQVVFVGCYCYLPYKQDY